MIGIDKILGHELDKVQRQLKFAPYTRIYAPAALLAIAALAMPVYSGADPEYPFDTTLFETRGAAGLLTLVFTAYAASLLVSTFQPLKVAPPITIAILAMIQVPLLTLALSSNDVLSPFMLAQVLLAIVVGLAAVTHALRL